MSTFEPLPPDEERARYYEGIRLFNEHEFFEAHEKWEDAWRGASGIKRWFYQGMIQCAVALVHYQRSNPHGVRSLHKTYVTKFAHVPAVFMGLDVPGFLSGMNDALKSVLEAESPLERGEVELDPTTVPQIVLSYDPFETGEAQRLDLPV